MPFFRFHFVEENKLAVVSRRLKDQLQQTIGCPRDHIVLEVVHASIIEDEIIKREGEWPFVEVDYFERPREIQDAVAKVVYDYLAEAGYANSDVHFRYLQPRNYYENGARYE